MYILGINAFHGDSSACLLKDGIIICASEEERFRRVKHWAGFPSESIKFCLNDAGITIFDIDYITVSRDPKAKFSKKVLYSLLNSLGFKKIYDSIINSKKIVNLKQEFAILFDVKIKSIKAQIHYIEHHRCHIASSFYASSFDKSLILSIDGFGDFTSTMTAVGYKNKIEVLDSVNFPHSLGIFYTSVTQFLGFMNYGDEYKIMGLAPYGEAKYIAELSQILHKTKNGFFTLNKKFFKHFKNGISMDLENGEPIIDSIFSKEWERVFWKQRMRGEKLEQFHIDLATSVQRFTEDIVFHILNKLHEKYNINNICITRGVAQNSVLNGKILANTPFKNIYIPSAGHDGGTSIGSALYLYNDILDNKRSPEIKTSYFGQKFSEKEITRCLEKNGVSFRRVSENELYNIVSDKLIEGYVIGWFQGRSEFGPRALGHRSILVDPRRKDAKDLLNIKIKRRESFRPFAPSILEEYVEEYFTNSDLVPFMEKVHDIRKDKYTEIPAVTHVDGTGRLQTVNKDISPKYHRLISEFHKKTGIPILLNTSFNENEPIVNNPDEALDCFLRTKMDMLVMENIIVQRNE